MVDQTARTDVEMRTMAKVTRRLLPFLMLCYFIAYLDRVNVGFAGVTMRGDLGLSAAAFGGAAGIFFIAYFLLEVPSNLALDRFGARVWIARIMFTWGLISGAQAFVVGETSFDVVRFLLGCAEAGFFPGIIFFLTLWFPSAYRARIVGMFMVAIPISTVIGAPISGWLLRNLDGAMGLHGWQWVFIVEALPALVLAFAVYFYLTDRPREAAWLTPEESGWLQARLDAERAHRESRHSISWRRAVVDRRVWGFGFVYMGLNIPQYGLSFFLPQIVKAFGLSDVETGFVTAIPYAVGAVGMILWSRSSDRTGERKWHTVIPLLCITVGMLAAAALPNPALRMACFCLAGFGFFAVYASFWAMPTAILSGTGAAAGIAAINSIGNLGGYFGPQVFGIVKDRTGGDAGGLLFFAACALVGAGIVLLLGHDASLERAPTQAAARAPTRA
ncbi:MFS transporter [Lichenibacterium dinghuense]|uniref:MFS transporter n=1 Tax=Lichenibacterium dinghuense TaxID=2895977 RepID=UPI001F167BD9|nr:MFS transporter [Lichenibacterium sp. 6Y81]